MSCCSPNSHESSPLSSSMARSSVRDSRSTREKQTHRWSTRSCADFFEKVSVYGPYMMCETSDRGTVGRPVQE